MIVDGRSLKVSRFVGGYTFIINCFNQFTVPKHLFRFEMNFISRCLIMYLYHDRNRS